MALLFPLIFLIANLGTLAVIWLGGLLVIGQDMTIGEVVAFNSYLMMTMFPLFMLGMIIAMVSQASASAARVFEILDAQSEVVAEMIPLAPACSSGGCADVMKGRSWPLLPMGIFGFFAFSSHIRNFHSACSSDE